MADEGNEKEGQNTPESQDGDKSRSQESIIAEMNRKFSKLNEDNARMSQILEQLAARQQAKPSYEANKSSVDEEKELADLVYTNPAEYGRRISERATKQATQVVQQTIQAQQQTNNVLTQLASEYPELADNASELTVKAVNIYKNMPETDRASTLAYKIAVRDAAAELGLLPKSKRPKDGGNEPNVGNSNSAVNEVVKGQQRNASKSNNKLDDKTLEFAKLMGLDTSKKEVVERLTKRNERKNWGKYE